ncbi:hypothetical protein CLHUN_09210 [Ruminiclostridium hungatei]|uniref:Uncharacterized protein n=1 Tax=Ruminiclostridium hungatei TaxID=48256 RepID=A0A1V4SQ06_RUMHU|nr:hypothetical protein [Ruminiclostridium hungatei]OPX45545.1 hypothetical protein CLHUN_09210 [Ruminiclostridium hungatei]
MGKLPDSISIGLTCNGCICGVSDKLIIGLSETPEKAIERTVSNIRAEMKKELSNAIFDNPKFRNQPMYFVDGWEMLLMTYPNIVKTGLDAAIAQAIACRGEYINTPASFTRQRKLPMETVIKLLVSEYGSII